MSNRAQNARRALAERQRDFDTVIVRDRNGRKRPGSENAKRSIPRGTGRRTTAALQKASRDAVARAGG